MAKNKFLIAPIKSGLVNNMSPWLIPEDAFERLENAYVYKGKVIKRFGSRYSGGGTSQILQMLHSRLRVKLLGGAGVGITSAIGTATGTVPGGGYSRAGGMFSIGTEYYTIQTTGNPVVMIGVNGVATTHTFDTTTGVYSFVAATADTQVYFYPGEPVMGLFNYEEGELHNRPAIACDTRLIYKFDGISWDSIGPIDAGAYVPFKGSNANFFDATNWIGSQFYNTYMFFTNFNATAPTPGANDDNMWYWDGATTWKTFKPQFLVDGDADHDIVVSARIIIPFKDRLVLLNPIEADSAGNNRAYKNRCRYSRNGTPDTTHPSVAWLEKDEVGYEGAGWIEAATEEEIISAEFIRDRLIVYFERSTWELAYTGSQTLPFVWQKLNTELGSESPRSSVPFDKIILTVGTTGIHACSGVNVERIDENIPDEIFNIRNTNDGSFRVAGTRDFMNDSVYWTVPYMNSGEYSDIFPNKVICFNYDAGTWSLNDDTITAFGYFEQQSGGETWEYDFQIWQEDLENWLEGVINPQPVQVIAGNQHGYVFTINKGVSVNESVLEISNITYAYPCATLTIINHNLKNGTFIKIENCAGSTELNNKHYDVTVVDVNTVTIYSETAVSAYTGLGVAALVSRIDILTKQFNPYIKNGSNVSVDKIDFCVKRTAYGQLDIQYFASSSDYDLVQGGTVSGALLGRSILETFPYSDFNPLEDMQNILWHPIYFQSSGEFIQIRLYASNEILFVPAFADEGFELEGMVLHTSPKGEL